MAGTEAQEMTVQTVTIGNATLYCGDCMDILPTLGDVYDLAIVDPPYGIDVVSSVYSGRSGYVAKTNGGYAVRGNFLLHDFDKARPSQEYFDALLRASKNQIIWGGNYFADLLPPSKAWIFWDKVNGQNDFSDGELAWSSFKTGVRQIELLWSGMLQGKAYPNGRTNEGDKRFCEKKIHPTQKPIKLYDWLYLKYANDCKTVLDTHLGSGGSAISALKAGLTFTGIEVNKDYFDIACKRIEQAVAQGQLFAPEPMKQVQEALL